MFPHSFKALVVYDVGDCIIFHGKPLIRYNLIWILYSFRIWAIKSKFKTNYSSLGVSTNSTYMCTVSKNDSHCLITCVSCYLLHVCHVIYYMCVMLLHVCHVIYGLHTLQNHANKATNIYVTRFTVERKP